MTSQTLVLAQEQIMAPVFSSIEEYLGQNTQRYYDVLAEVGQARWSPRHDARPWLRFCLTAHYRQARTQLRRIEETERLYAACAEIAEGLGLPERATGALVEAAYGFRLTHASYKKIVELTAGETVASLTDANRRETPSGGHFRRKRLGCLACPPTSLHPSMK
jgi:hypothetical protein